MKKKIPYSCQWIDKNDIKAVVAVLQSDRLTCGPKILEFEKKFSRFVKAKHAVAVSSGTAALHLACLAAGIKPGDKVITTPFSFAATANCILYCRAKPVFVDIKKDTLSINPVLIEKKISRKTKAIIPVDFAGQPADLDKIMTIAKEHNLLVIEDAAHSLGSVYRGKPLGSVADLTCFSFHPVKNITTGEGGMITTNNKKFYEKLLLLRNHGITKDKKRMSNFDGPWFYEMQDLGYNYRLTDMQAALGISQLKKLPLFMKRRREIVKIYNQAFADLTEVTTPFEKPETMSCWHLYVIRLKLELLKGDRRKIFEEFRKKGLGVQVHYIPIYRHPYYQKRFHIQTKEFPVTEKIYDSIISLPLFPKMKDAEVNYVIKAIKTTIKKFKK